MCPIKVQMASPLDAEELLAIYCPYVEKTAISFECTVPSVLEFQSRICHTLEQFPYLKAVDGGKILGYAYASPFKERAAYSWAVETSIYVAQEKRRAGVGTALYRVLEEILARQHVTNVNACIACVDGADPYLANDSVYFHERMGYRLVGRFVKCGYKFNRWYDMVWMEKHIGVHRENQPAVRPFGEVRGILWDE